MDRCSIKIITGSCLLKSKQNLATSWHRAAQGDETEGGFSIKAPAGMPEFPLSGCQAKAGPHLSISLLHFSSSLRHRITASRFLPFSLPSLPPALRRDADSRGADDGDDANAPRRRLGISFALLPFPRGARRLSAGVVIFYRVQKISFSSS